MLRITLETDAVPLRVVLEGRLTHACVDEADTSWRHVLAVSDGRPVEVDLRDVLAIDDGGRALLRRMARAGARLVAVGCAMREVVREAAEAGEGRSAWIPEDEKRLS